MGRIPDALSQGMRRYCHLNGQCNGYFSLVDPARRSPSKYETQIAVDYLTSKTSQKRLHKLIQALHPYILLRRFNLRWRKLGYHLHLQLFS